MQNDEEVFSDAKLNTSLAQANLRNKLREVFGTSEIYNLYREVSKKGPMVNSRTLGMTW